MGKFIDVVIPLSAGSTTDDLELRYCLRSLEKNFLCLGKIYIVGHKPEWVKNVRHIECEDINLRNKDANIIRKITLACKNKTLSEDFLFVSDDQLVINPVGTCMLLCDGDMREWLKTMSVTTRWKLRYQNTALKFNKSINFDTHTPQPYKKSEFIQIESIYPDVYTEGEGYIINSLYFNHFGYSTNKTSKDYKLELRDFVPYKKIESNANKKLYLSYNPKGFTDELRKYLDKTFPEKSIFEKY